MRKSPLHVQLPARNIIVLFESHLLISQTIYTIDSVFLKIDYNISRFNVLKVVHDLHSFLLSAEDLAMFQKSRM